MTRRRWWALGVVAALLLVGSGALFVRWQGSVGHRADELAESLRSMPGVVSVTWEEESDDEDSPRDVDIRMSPTVDRPSLDDVVERLGPIVDGEVIDDADLSVGSATLEIGSYRTSSTPQESDVDQLFALRALPKMTATLRGGDDRVRIERSGQTPIQAAQQTLGALDAAGVVVEEVTVASTRRTNESTIRGDGEDGLDLAVARRQLDLLAPAAASVTSFTINQGAVELTANARSTALLGRLVRAGQRAVALAPEDEGQPTVEVKTDGSADAGVPVEVTAGLSEDPTAALATVDQLGRKGLPVSSIDAARERVELAPSAEDSEPPALASVLSAVRALRPALPASTTLSVELPDNIRIDTSREEDSTDPDGSVGFRGTVADLARLAPRLTSLKDRGYRVLWDGAARQYGPGTPSTSDVTIVLPKEAVLDEATTRRVLGIVRSLPWPGSADVVLLESKKEDASGYPPGLEFRSTATGRTAAVRTSASTSYYDQPPPAVDESTARDLWNASATTPDTTASR